MCPPRNARRGHVVGAAGVHFAALPPHRRPQVGRRSLPSPCLTPLGPSRWAQQYRPAPFHPAEPQPAPFSALEGPGPRLMRSRSADPRLGGGPPHCFKLWTISRQTRDTWAPFPPVIGSPVISSARVHSSLGRWDEPASLTMPSARHPSPPTMHLGRPIPTEQGILPQINAWVCTYWNQLLGSEGCNAFPPPQVQ